MEANQLEKFSPQVCDPLATNDAEYVSGLSTILVATIQEAKDRISQIEYIFCSQLYPNFQKNSRCLQKLYSEARRAAEDEWKERENELELQLKERCLEKEQALEECNALKSMNSKLLRRIAELGEQLLQKTKEVDDGIELHGKLLDLIELKTSMITEKENWMKEHEEQIKLLISKLQRLEGNIEALNKELQEKNEELIRGNEHRDDLLRQIESQMLKIGCSEQMLSNTEREKKQLTVQIENVEANIDGLRDELRRKTLEIEEGKKLQEQLVQQGNLNNIELQEKKLLLSRIKDLENKVKELQENARNRIDGLTERSEYENDLAPRIKLMNSELLSEKQKRRDAVAAYKKLKSQYNFLCSKVALTKEDMLPIINTEDEGYPMGRDNRIIHPPEIKVRDPICDAVACELNKVKKERNCMETSDEGKGGRVDEILSSNSPTSSNCPATIHLTTNRNSGSSAGIKRRASGWRDTRSRHSPGGPDPHDDFLDTPYENIRGNLQKVMNDNIHDIPAQIPEDMDSDSSDDQTQDLRAESEPKKQQLQVPRPGPRGFKYVEPVRKISDRENLNGIECKQCKKFYDAILSGGKDAEEEIRNYRCEHHDGISRHRYRYVPPMTPEGFWNIGFDTES